MKQIGPFMTTWMTQRRLPARVRIALLIGMVALLGVMGVWLRPSPAHATDVLTGDAFCTQLHTLRVQDKDFAQVQALAGEYLATHPERTLQRQRVQFEQAMSYFDARDYAVAKSALEALIADYEPRAWDAHDADVVLDDAWFWHAETLSRAGALTEAREGFLAVRAQFPGSDVRGKALQYVSRTFIHEELQQWYEPDSDVTSPWWGQRWPEINANLDTLVQESAPSDVLAGAYLDAINYLTNRSTAFKAERLACQAEVVKLVDEAVAHAPNEPKTYYARLNKAALIFADNPNEAWALLDVTATYADRAGDGGLLNDAQFSEGMFCTRTGRHTEAQQTWQALLSRPQTPLFQGEVRCLVGQSYLLTGQLTAALAAYEGVLATTGYPDTVYSGAATAKALTLLQMGHHNAALETLAQIERTYAGDRSAAFARRVADSVKRWR